MDSVEPRVREAEAMLYRLGDDTTLTQRESLDFWQCIRDTADERATTIAHEIDTHG